MNNPLELVLALILFHFFLIVLKSLPIFAAQFQSKGVQRSLTYWRYIQNGGHHLTFDVV